MNVHGIASRAINRVNRDVPIQAKVSTGYTIDTDGTQIPTYKTINTKGNVQPLSATDLKRVEAMNVQSITQKVILRGDFEGVFKETGRGGDLLIIGNSTYLVVSVIERWANWCVVGVALQVD